MQDAGAGWWRFNGWGRVAASIGGGLAYIAIYLMWPQMAWWTRMVIGMSLATVFWILATMITAPESKELLLAFYRRARPLGSWEPIRNLADEPAQAQSEEIMTGMGLR